MNAKKNAALSQTVTITNKRGLHARASAEFVRVATQYKAEMLVSKLGSESDGERVCGTSIMGLMMLAAAPGSVIQIDASGPEAPAALAALVQLVTDRFNED